jgi:hypothetical protein
VRRFKAIIEFFAVVACFAIAGFFLGDVKDSPRLFTTILDFLAFCTFFLLGLSFL